MLAAEVVRITVGGYARSSFASALAGVVDLDPSRNLGQEHAEWAHAVVGEPGSTTKSFHKYLLDGVLLGRLVNESRNMDRATSLEGKSPAHAPQNLGQVVRVNPTERVAVSGAKAGQKVRLVFEPGGDGTGWGCGLSAGVREVRFTLRHTLW
jgi:hypothetical protein